MPAQIYELDVFGECLVGEERRAWHEMGEVIPDNMNCEEAFIERGMNWGTQLLPMVGVLPGGDVVQSDECFLHVREDTKTSLGVVGKDYRPLGNMELARFVDSLVGADARVRVATCGTLRNGRKIYTSVRLPRNIEVVDGDILELYLIASSAHDGSAATHLYPSSIRPVCANTLGWSERDLVRGLRIQHTGDIATKVDQARQILGIVVKETERFRGDIDLALRLNLTKEKAKEYFKAVYNRVFGKVDEPVAAVATDPANPPVPGEIEIGTATTATRLAHRDKMVQGWLDLMDDPKQNIKGIAGTGWAAYNAFSQWSDHVRGTTRGVLDNEARLHINLFGIGDLTKRRAWKSVVDLAKVG